MVLKNKFFVLCSILLPILFLVCFCPGLRAQNSSIPPTVGLSFVGDVMAHDSNYKTEDFSHIYRSIKPLLEKTELNFANLEFVIDEQRPYSTYPVFNVRAEYVNAVSDAGFNTFSLANNHSADFGLAGVRATEKSSHRLRRESPGLTFSGLRPAGQGPDSFVMESIRHRGRNIGFTAISILSNSHKGIGAVQYIRPDDDILLNSFYRWLAGQRPNYDLVIVSVHGGVEYQPEPSARKRGIMRRIARNGADIIWGHHPHVQQPWEVFTHNSSKQHRWSLIMYSQGNFISAQTIRTKPNKPQGFWAATGDSVLLQVQLAWTATGLELRGLKPLLLTTIRLRPRGFAVTPMENAAAEMRSQGYDGWDNFYAQRQRALEQRVAQWPQIP
ncbi:CapA family protein [Candidatus Haliotispira prima]|uniref:CapA family protein n=1 Tax=Candidatus Haliotispira prima TaxID=3034016 RepID=A0ABY8MJX2_9SPIO|nr:CapA family protein [Candidatus Haliotispira prima]